MVASFWRRNAVKVRLNRSLFPADFLSIQAAGDHELDDVSVELTTADSLLKGRSGDGWDVGRLSSAQSVDLMLHTAQHQPVLVPSASLTYAHLLAPGNPIFAQVKWGGVDGNDRSGRVAVTWTYEERAQGLNPRIAFDSDVDALEEYVLQSDRRVTGDLMRKLARRVRRMSRYDIESRYRREKKYQKEFTMSGGSALAGWASSIEIRGFRGFREQESLHLAAPNRELGSGLTIVVGANNSGKSTIWEAFDAIARKSKSDVSFSEGRRNQQAPEGVRLSLNRTDGSSFTVESRRVNTSETKSSWSPAGVGPEAIEIVSVPSRRQFQSSFSKGSVADRDWMSNGQEFSRQRQPDFQFTGRLFDLHNNEAKKAKFDELMTQVLGQKLDWSIDLAEGQNGMSSYFLRVTTGEGASHTSEGLGDGIVSLLFILNALYDSEPSSLLVFDEPELSLHPQFVRRLGDLIAHFARDRQIVIFTHSPMLISWDSISKGAAIARVYKEKGDSRIAQPDRSVIDEVSKIRGGWRNPHALGIDANAALFLDDEIIVVEGQEDTGLLPTVFEQAGVEPRGTVFGWGSGGGDKNPRRIVALLESLGFSKVVALLDNDKPDEVAAILRDFPRFFATSIPAGDIRDKPDGKSGLLDEKGRLIKPELKEATAEVLQSVVDYFDHGRSDATIPVQSPADGTPAEG